jgi:hypothetical protein
MKIACPCCNLKLEASEELCGQRVECPACRSEISIPDTEIPSSTKAQNKPVKKLSFLLRLHRSLFK